MTSERMKPDDITVMANRVGEYLKDGIHIALQNATKCCPNCERFTPNKEICKLNNMRPPANIIAFGCEMFEDVFLPF
jgi:hypothetical protein